MAKISIPERKVTELPEHQLYAEYQPAFKGPWPTALAREHMAELLQFDTVAVNTDKAIERRIDLIRAVLRIKFEQIVGNTVWRNKKPATEEEWNAAPRTIVKTAEDALSHPVDRVVFDRKELQTERQVGEAMGAIVIDPRRINDTLLNNLGLEQYMPEKGTKRVPALVRRAEAIPEIQDMMAHLKPFSYIHEETDESQQRYFRLMRIVGGKNNGYTLGTQTKANGDKTLFKSDIYGARRRLEHVIGRSEEEVIALKGIENILKEMQKSLNKRHEIQDPEGMADLRKSLSEVVDKLEFVEKEEKIKLREQIKKALTVRYKYGKQNPGAMLACVATALESLGKRLASIERTGEFMGKDRTRLQSRIEEEQIPTQSFLAKVEKHHHELRILQPSEKPLTQPEIQKIRGNLQTLLEEAKNMQHQPNLMFGEKYVEIITRLIQQLDSYKEDDIEGHENLKKQFVTLYALGKMHRAMIDLKKVHYTVSVEEKTYDPKDLSAELEKIYAQMRQTRIAQSVTTPEMRDPYIAVYDHLRSLIDEAKKNLEGESSGKTAKTEPTITEILIQKIQNHPLLRRMVEALKIQQKKPAQQPLPFTVDKQKTAKALKDMLKGFKWEDILEAI